MKRCIPASQTAKIQRCNSQSQIRQKIVRFFILELVIEVFLIHLFELMDRHARCTFKDNGNCEPFL